MKPNPKFKVGDTVKITTKYYVRECSRNSTGKVRNSIGRIVWVQECREGYDYWEYIIDTRQGSLLVLEMGLKTIKREINFEKWQAGWLQWGLDIGMITNEAISELELIKAKHPDWDFEELKNKVKSSDLAPR